MKFDLILYAVLLSGSLLGAYCNTLPSLRKYRQGLYLASLIYDLSFMSWLIVGVIDSASSGNWKLPLLLFTLAAWGISMICLQPAKKKGQSLK